MSAATLVRKASDFRQRALEAQRRNDDREALDKARRDEAAARLEAYIEATVASAPPLTSEQRSRLAALLGGGAR